MSTETKIFLGVIGGTFLLIIAAALFSGSNSSLPADNSAPVSESVLIRPDSHQTGSDSARVTVVEFSDFECPACKAAEPEVENLISQYKDQILFVDRNFPLPAHQYAFTAAAAAEAAGLQMKYWDYHNELFRISPDLTRDNLIGLAHKLNLDVSKFAADMDSDAVRQRVLDDQADGNKAGVNATPTFFVNGKKIVGASGLEAAIAQALK